MSFFSSALFAQQVNGSLTDRWSKMLEQAETYEPYKVIKKTELDYFWKTVNDSIGFYKAAIKKAKNTAVQQRARIEELKKEFDETQTLLKLANEESDSITFLGITANKYVYLSLIWICLLISLVAIGFLVVLYKNSHVVAAEKVNAYEKVLQEFNQYKQGKLDLERKLKRELQTQLNLIEELRRLN